jgi:hypothetical protein
MTEKDLKIIEDAEREGIPIFVLTAKDLIAVNAITSYYNACCWAKCNDQHCNAIERRIEDFKTWKALNPDKMKLPD